LKSQFDLFDAYFLLFNEKIWQNYQFTNKISRVLSFELLT